jgi:SAM-dependent methyltransferase
VPFDRAAEYYDRTRALPEDVQDKVVELLTHELAGRGPCLDIGVGTGRISLPVAERGVRLTGIDLSVPMLRKLIEKRGDLALSVAVADATRLSFRAHTFGGALTSHVLHLIPEWRQALSEMVRVVRPGGVVLIDVGGWWPGWLGGLFGTFCDLAGLDRAFPGANGADEVAEAMAGLGATHRSPPPIAGTTVQSAAEAIERLESGLFSFTWPLEEWDRRAAAAGTAEWARSNLGPLEEPRELELEITWHVFDVQAEALGAG